MHTPQLLHKTTEEYFFFSILFWEDLGKVTKWFSGGIISLLSSSIKCPTKKIWNKLSGCEIKEYFYLYFCVQKKVLFFPRFILLKYPKKMYTRQIATASCQFILMATLFFSLAFLWCRLMKQKTSVRFHVCVNLNLTKKKLRSSKK